ncbi:hypothetical protein IAI10_10340 [Clostridium sp. 19966]|uniref:HNH endonuclease n=2 Tax=root TaxID=1 RepID=A0A6N2ZWB0_CLOBU|nr:hypothetical protein [Clostridium sp. 19966]MDT8717057.1 hypothetical protein [Clostridium sp. 19966]
MAKRDDFSPKVKDTLAKRVGYICSNPNCNQETIGPHSDPNKSLSTGIAAHITAAAPGGARYNPNLTSEQRKSIDNGIWLCEYCAGLIDVDEVMYPVSLLLEWKQAAEMKMFQLQNLRDKKVNFKSELEFQNSIKIINTCINNIDDMYEYFYMYYKNNFSHFRNHLEAMNSLNTHFQLHESSLRNIINLNEYRNSLMIEFSKIELDMNNEISELIKEFDSLGNFTYESDNIGFYNNYYEKFFLMVIESYEQRKKIKEKITKEIRKVYKK